METILKATEKPFVEEMAEFLKGLTPEEQQEIRIFIQGVKFARRDAPPGEKKSA